MDGAGRETAAEQTRDRIRVLLDQQPFAVLCTQGDGQPYGSVIAFAVAPDLGSVAFATPRATKKYRLLGACASVALVVDSRSRFPGDVDRIEAITATGRAVELAPGPEFDRWADRLAGRHPQLGPFFRDPSSAIFRIDVDCYVHVSHLQQVREWIPGSGEGSHTHA